MTGTPQNSSGETPQPAEKQITLQDILIPIWANRKPILIISFAAAIVTLLINFFLLPVYYKATATLLPETQKNKLSSLGQFTDIAQLAGVSVPGSEIARLYPTIIGSETILRNVIEKKYQTKAFADSVNLMQYLEVDEDTPEKNMARAITTVRALMTSSFDNKTSIVSLTMEMKEPELAADVLNSLIDQLDGFMRFKKFSNASEQVKWIDVRLKEVQHELRSSEENLKNFREKNRRVADSPELLLQQERLGRDVQVKSTIFVELKKQYELAKLEEIKNLTIVNVLDPGRAPVKKERPKRGTNSAIAFIISIMVLSVYYAGARTYGQTIDKYWKALRSDQMHKI